MNKLTEAEFLDFYSKAYGELTDKLGQIAYHKFTGEELFEFVNDAIEYWAKNQRSGYDTEIKRDFNSYYCEPPILAEVIRVPESPKIYETPKVKTLKDKFDDVRIYVSSFFSK